MLGSCEGLLGGMVAQKLLNDEGGLDWGAAIAETGFSAVMTGFAWKAGWGVKGGKQHHLVVAQKLLNDEGGLDWGAAIAETGFSAVMTGFAWKAGWGVKGGKQHHLEKLHLKLRMR